MATKPKTPRGAAAPKAAKAAVKAAGRIAESDAADALETGTKTGKVLRARDLIDAVTATTGAKKTLVKDIVAATLAAMGDALAEGRALNLPPLGKAHVSRTKERGSAELLVIKLRRGGAGPTKPVADAATAETLAEPAD